VGKRIGTLRGRSTWLPARVTGRRAGDPFGRPSHFDRIDAGNVLRSAHRAAAQQEISLMTLVRLAFVAAFSLGFAGTASAQAITGDWLTENGERVTIAPCGNGYCSTVATGAYQGQRIAEVSGAGPEYPGTITDPSAGRTYKGSMTVRGAELDLKGCLMEMFCKTVQSWRRP
jgi:uncharacterized protein (DUF2147 family)